MATIDATLHEGDTGAYELAIPANTMYTVLVQGIADSIQVIAHSGESPVYLRVGDTVTLKDPDATMLLPGSWLDVPIYGVTIRMRMVRFICADDCVVSVTK